jgi:alpha-glucuronidase
MIRFFCLLIFCCLASGSYASEADSLWLRMPAPKTAAEVITRKMTPTIQVAVAELKHGWRGVPVCSRSTKVKLNVNWVAMAIGFGHATMVRVSQSVQ